MKITTTDNKTLVLIFCISINITFLTNVKVFTPDGLFTKEFLAVTALIPGTWILLSYNAIRFMFNVCWKVGKRVYRWNKARQIKNTRRQYAQA